MHHALILAGGSGTRLWPYSNAQRPKQLVPLFGGASLLEQAFGRARAVLPPERIWLGANEAMRKPAHAGLPELRADRFIAEPCAKDTLAAVGLGCAAILAADPDATVAVLTSDHLIEPVADFADAIQAALALADDRPETLITFGVRPTHAATGYGYLRLGPPLDRTTGARQVVQFHEKPPLESAQKWVAAGPEAYLWNSGMFVWKAATFLRAVDRFAPAHAPVLRAMGQAFGSPAYARIAATSWAGLTRQSVDHGVMEPASLDAEFQVAALPLHLRWLDVGSWPAYADAIGRDERGNARGAARMELLDSTDCLVASSDPDHLVTLVGCEGLVVVHTPQATLVCRADQAQKIKDLHAQVLKNAPSLA